MNFGKSQLLILQFRTRIVSIIWSSECWSTSQEMKPKVSTTSFMPNLNGIWTLWPSRVCSPSIASGLYTSLWRPSWKGKTTTMDFPLSIMVSKLTDWLILEFFHEVHKSWRKWHYTVPLVWCSRPTNLRTVRLISRSGYDPINTRETLLPLNKIQEWVFIIFRSWHGLLQLHS